MDKRSYEGLDVWQKAHELMLSIHKEIVPLIPSDEKWDLIHQIRSSSKSIGANIAEGHGRYYFMDNVRTYYNTRGSLSETINHLIDAHDLGYITPEFYEEARERADTNHRLLNGYISYLKHRKVGSNEPGANIHPKEFTNNQVTKNQITDN